MGGLKNRYGKDHALWERSITPPQLLHGSTAAFRTDGQVNVPDRFEQFCHGQPGITLPESLAALDPEDYFQVPGFHPVIKETIVPDLLETGGDTCIRNRRINSSWLMVISRFGSPGFFPRAEKVTSVSVTDRIRLLEMATRWVYRPRYSIAFPKPLKVSLIYGHQSFA